MSVMSAFSSLATLPAVLSLGKHAVGKNFLNFLPVTIPAP